MLPPAAVVLIGEMILVIAVLFVHFRRPMYECMAFGLFFVAARTGRYDLLGGALLVPSTSTVFYAIVAFLLFAHVLGRTRVLDGILSVIMALVGGLRGGAGYVSLLGSTFMAALSGTGPGNVAATGVFTIPAMVRSGYPRALAATTEMAASALGNIIPPSGIVFLSYAIYNEMYPGQIGFSQVWWLAWGVGIWFFAQRWLTLYLLCLRYHVTPLPRDARPHLRRAVAENWAALGVPLVIFLPLIFDSVAGDWLSLRLGSDGRALFSDIVVVATPGLAAAYTLLIAHLTGKAKLGWTSLLTTSRSAVEQVVPVAATVYLAYAIAVVMGEVGMGEAVQGWLLSLGLGRWTMALFLPLFTMVLGMVMPGSSQIAILGAALMGTYAALGGDPLVLMVLLPAITGALEGMTPPLALGMYAAMGIAGSDFGETARLALVWVLAHIVLAMALLAGLLPVLGI